MARPQTRRPKGEGSIQRLPNGNYKAVITIGYDVEGKQKRKSVTAKTKTELMQKLAEVRINAGLEVGRSLTFEEVYKMFLKQQEGILSPNSMRSYRYTERDVFEQLYRYPIDKIKGERIDSLLDSLKRSDGKPLSPSSVVLKKRLLSAIFNFACLHNLLGSSPMLHTRKRARPTKKVDKVILPSEDELKAILEQAKEYDKTTKEYPSVYAFILLDVATGLRFGEILDIDRQRDINLKDNTITIRTQCTRDGNDQPLKTASSRRTIFVNHEVLCKVLDMTPKGSKTTKLWNLHGYPMRMNSASKWLRRFFKFAKGLPKGFTFHCFRHYHATYLLKQKFDIKEVSKRLGHSNIKTTLEQYAHWLPEVDQQAGNSIGGQFL